MYTDVHISIYLCNIYIYIDIDIHRCHYCLHYMFLYIIIYYDISLYIIIYYDMLCISSIGCLLAQLLTSANTRLSLSLCVYIYIYIVSASL